MTIEDAVRLHLNAVMTRVGDVGISEQDLLGQIPDVFCTISWNEVAECVASQMNTFSSADPSVMAAIRRLANEIDKSIKWHA